MADTWRFVICRVHRKRSDPDHGRLRPIADVPTYSAACLFADVARDMIGSEFAVYDSHEKRLTPYRWKPSHLRSSDRSEAEADDSIVVPSAR